MKIPYGYDISARPKKGASNIQHIVNVVIRECMANANTYKATDCHAVHVTIDGLPYLMFAHNGIPFVTGKEIMDKGCLPNESNDEGWSYQGSGLSFCASYLHSDAELVIISQTTQSGYQAARAYPNRSTNDWVIVDAPDWVNKVGDIVGHKFMKGYNVIYLFRLPKASIGTTTFSVELMNSLLWMAPSMLEGDTKLCVTESFYRKDRLDKTGAECGYLGDYMMRNRGSAVRPIVPQLEYKQRYQEKEWTLYVPNVDVKVNGEQLNFDTRITISAFPSTVSPKGHQWIANERDGISLRGGKAYKAGKGSAPGRKPKCSTYLTIPALSEGQSERFGRFRDNAVYFDTQAAHLFRAMGLRYQDGRSTGGNPFCILQVEVIDVNTHQILEDAEDPTECSPIEFAFPLGRRPDFLINQQAGRAIVGAACQAVPPQLISEEMKEWFDDHFPAEQFNRCPITFDNGNRLNVKDKKEPLVVYDVTSGDIFGHKFKKGERRYLVVWSPSDKKLVDEMKVSQATRGVDIGKASIQHKDLHLASKDIVDGYLKIKESLLAQGHISEDDNDSMTLFSVAISDSPTRGVHVVVNDDKYRLGVVEDVPKSTSGTPSTPTGGGQGRNNHAFPSEPYEVRDQRIAVTWDGDMMLLNPNHPKLRHFDAQEESGTEVQQLLLSLYHEVLSVIGGIIQALENVQVEGWEDRAADYVDEEDQYIHRDAVDWTINQAACHYLAESSYVERTLSRVAAIRGV